MKQLVIIGIILLSGLRLFAQQEKSYVKKGNELYQQKKYKEAEADYRQALAKKNQNIEGNFNLGDALYKQKQFDKAGEQFNKLGESNNKPVAAKAFHNLGNTLFESKKLEESIEAYKKSLLNNPKDDETRYNLAYAQEKLKQQQQKDKNNKNKKDNKQNKDQQKKDQDKNKKDQDKKNQDKQKQDQDKQNQQKQDQKQQPQPNKLSKDDAQRMLDALNNNEKQTQDKLKNKKLKGAKVQVSKDW